MLFDLSDELKAFQARVREVARGEIAPHAAETDRTEAYPWHCVEILKREGLLGLTIPAALGGGGASYLHAVLLIEEMAKACSTTGRICVKTNMGALGAIMEYGSDAQRELAASLVLAGDKPAICITEPQAGSAATELTTRADRKGDAYVLNGRKHWIAGGGVSRLHLIFARVFDDGIEQGIGGFIVVRDAAHGTPAGLIVGTREPAMGVRGLPETEIILDDLEVGADMMLLPPQGIRKGFAGLMEAYNGQRVGAATVALGIAESAYELASTRASATTRIPGHPVDAPTCRVRPPDRRRHRADPAHPAVAGTILGMRTPQSPAARQILRTQVAGNPRHAAASRDGYLKLAMAAESHGDRRPAHRQAPARGRRALRVRHSGRRSAAAGRRA